MVPIQQQEDRLVVSFLWVCYDDGEESINYKWLQVRGHPEPLCVHFIDGTGPPS